MRDRLGICDDDPRRPQRGGHAIDGTILVDPRLVNGAGVGVARDKVADPEEPALPWRTSERRLAGGLAAGEDEVAGEVDRSDDGGDLPERERRHDVCWDDHGAGREMSKEGIVREVGLELMSQTGGRQKRVPYVMGNES